VTYEIGAGTSGTRTGGAWNTVSAGSSVVVSAAASAWAGFSLSPAVGVDTVGDITFTARVVSTAGTGSFGIVGFTVNGENLGNYNLADGVNSFTASNGIRYNVDRAALGAGLTANEFAVGDRITVTVRQSQGVPATAATTGFSANTAISLTLATAMPSNNGLTANAVFYNRRRRHRSSWYPYSTKQCRAKRRYVWIDVY
jgi:hypothetical protein